MRVLEDKEFKQMITQLEDVRFTTPGAGDSLQSPGRQRGAVLMEFCKGWSTRIDT